MPSIEMSEQEWQQIMNLLGTKCLWVEANPLLMKIGTQLQRQQHGNSQEVPVPQPHLESKPTH